MAHAVLISRWVALGLLLSGCGPPPVAPAPALPRPTSAVATLPDSGWDDVRSARFSLSFPLPDARVWQLHDAEGPWFVATHAPSTSRLVARAWREGSVIRRASCEEQARRWNRQLFGQDAEALTGRRPLGAPEGFEAEVAFLVNRKGDAWGGVVVATAASVRRCVALAFATRTEGAGAQEELSRRLALVERGVYSAVRVLAVDDRARGRSAPLDAVDGR